MKPQHLVLLLACLLFTRYHATAQADPSRSAVKFFFPGDKLAADHQFKFAGNFKEVNIKTADSTLINAVLFKADSSKGVILYLKGNTGSIEKWEGVAKVYTSLHYDLFMSDYRGYGKSQGSIKNEAQLYADMQATYNYLLTIYPENKIIVLGYSIGTGPAAYLAAHNHPKKLILQAPYYTLPDAVKHLRPGYDTATIAFHFNTALYLRQTTAPVIIFHGDADQIFYYGSSQKLQAQFKPGDELITLPGAGHAFMDRNALYLRELERVLD